MVGLSNTLSYAQSGTSLVRVTVEVALGTTAAQLQTLINAAAAGTTFQLQTGHYNFDRTVTIDRDDIGVVGAGSGKTFINVPKSLGAEAFHVGSGNETGAFTLAADMAEGSKTMVLTGSHSFVAGDFVYMARESTTAFYDQIGDQSWRNTDVALRTSIVEVVAVDGANITLASGVHFDFTRGETQVREIGMAENVSLGGFTVSYGLSVADPSQFANTLTAYSRNAVIEVEGTADLNLFDVTAHNVPSLGVNFASSTGVNATGLTMTGAHNKGDGGNGYGLQIRDVYDSSFTGISDADMRHSVVFASWTSAVGNVVHVTRTDRDINFHGGRDHDNVVTVDNSIRDANSDIIGPTLFVNTSGTHYGTVTDAGANTVSFGKVVGSRLGDKINGYDSGSWLDGRGGDDSLTGGSGNDLLIGGTGRDVLNGGAGVDIVQYTGRHADFTILRQSAGSFSVQDRTGTQSTDQVIAAEWLLFDDAAIRLSDMSVGAVSAVAGVFGGVGSAAPAQVQTAPVVQPVPAPVPISEPLPVTVLMVGTAGKDVFNVDVAGTTVQGLADFDTVRATVSFTLSADVERLDLMGTAAINGTGSARDNHLHGNDARNILQGMEGIDRLWGKGGDDLLMGGAGDDQINGDAGNDRIDGGAGQDKLFGGAGADVFVFTSTNDSARLRSDKVLDFQTGQDRIDLTAIDADTTIVGNQAFVWGNAGADGASLWMRNGYLFGDTNHDSIADMSIYVKGVFGHGDVLL